MYNIYLFCIQYYNLKIFPTSGSINYIENYSKYFIFNNQCTLNAC